MLLTKMLLALVSLLEGPSLPKEPAGWLAVVSIAVFSTLLPIVFFFAGMQRIGANDAATLSTLEPVVTLLLAYVFLAEVLCAR